MTLIAAAVALPSPSAAVEGGGSLWILGSAGFGAGVIPEPGFHLGKRFDFGLTAGLFGFWYRQTTADGGRGATTGNLKGKAWGIGPMLQYSGEVLGVPVSSTVRYQKVFQHMNRTIDLPLDEQLKFSVGYAKRGESKWGHAISASVLWLGDGEVDQTAQGARFKGEFDSNWMFIIGANLQYRF